MNKQLKKLTFTAIMVALATVLSMIKVIQMPLGGSVTLISMLPIIVVSITLGIGWGFGGAFAYSLIQLILGIASDGLLGWGLSGGQLAGCIALDYIVAYTVLGIAGVFGSKNTGSLIGGTVLAMTLRFLSHFASGYIIFANFEQFAFFGKTFVGRPILYSVCYNGFYMLPELAITCVVVFILSKAGIFDKIKSL